MNTASQILPVVQLILAILLIALILMQRAGEGMEGGALGGGGSSNVTYFARRGGERFLFIATITIAIAFAVSAIAAILI